MFLAVLEPRTSLRQRANRQKGPIPNSKKGHAPGARKGRIYALKLIFEALAISNCEIARALSG
jgi:hypothetical protein